MLFNKKRSLFREINDDRVVAYDFRRRTDPMFENYRSIGYLHSSKYDLDKTRTELVKTLKDLFEAGAVDSGNKDCLIEQILGPIRQELTNLDIQRANHLDFYQRYKIRWETDSHDVESILKQWEDKRNEILKSREETLQLIDNYNLAAQEKEEKARLKKNKKLESNIIMEDLAYEE